MANPDSALASTRSLQKSVGSPTPSSFSGPGEFAQRIREAIDMACEQNWPLMVWSDVDFQDWPLCERAVIDSLQGWAQKDRTLRILARRFDAFPRLHPRFVVWRQQWDHIIECRVCAHVPSLELPSALWSSHHAVQRLDVERSVGWVGDERTRLAQIRAELDECARHGSPGFPASTLGL